MLAVPFAEICHQHGLINDNKVERIEQKENRGLGQNIC
jgi:hypothetical protein